ncbi:hypothetical protein [Marimonas lutisalis]|uniref:hypothetical protein n=1 Tax=Marimonas lutisalis TaxID=2545756 RepID=UPI0010F82A71|nr:hypothetical protein [Marimonas lutisalis]
MNYLLSILSICLLLMVSSGAKAKDFHDADWNWKAEPKCGFPKRDSVRWMRQGERRFLRFQVRDGDIGKCNTDNDKAHGKKFKKPWSERAEIKGPAFKEEGIYKVSFDVRFVQGFDQNRTSTTFFQIKDCPDSRVPVMAMLGGWNKRNGGPAKFGFSLAVSSPGHKWISRPISPDPVDNRWRKVEIIFENYSTQALTVSVGGKTWLPRTTFQNIFYCGRPTLDLGIYRAGDPGKNAHSIVDYDKVTIEKIK